MKNTVTPEQVKENMQDIIVRTLVDFGKPTTYVTIRMKNGFTLRESTTCVDPENYDEEIRMFVCFAFGYLPVIPGECPEDKLGLQPG